MPTTAAPYPEWGSLPFDEAIQYFRAKLDIPTSHWDDLWQAAHDRAFTVAGAASEALLADLREAVDAAIAAGTTLEQFRKDFRAIVIRHGWTGWTGEGDAAGVAWRTEVIYGTNCATAYAAGRWTQLTHPDVTSRMPYWMYRHSDSVAHPRPLHVSWDGLVLPWNHPWWKTHFTPNGWGCMCYVVALSDKDLRALGKKGPDQPPNDGTYEWINKRTGEVHQVPEGIDPGWDYAPGASGPFGPGPSKPTPAPAPAPAPAPRRPVSAPPSSWEWVSSASHAKLARLGAQRVAELIDQWVLPDDRAVVRSQQLRGRPLGEALTQPYVTALDIVRAMPALRAHIYAALRQHRHLGEVVRLASGSSDAAADLLQRASNHYPADWVRFGNSSAVTVHVTTPEDRGFYRNHDFVMGTPYILTDPGSTVEHEYAHHLQATVPGLDRVYRREHRLRTNGDPLEVLYPHTPSEVGRPDGYVTRYQGKEYSFGPGPREVLTMALQAVAGSDTYADMLLAKTLLQDRKMLELTLGLLFHFKPEAP